MDPWVVEEVKKFMQCGLIGFLKSSRESLQIIKYWLNVVGGKGLIRLSVLDEVTVWMIFVFEGEAEEARKCATADLSSSPFSAVER